MLSGKVVAPKGWYNQGSNTDSVVGYDTLSQFKVRIDYPRERMWLRRVRTDLTFMGVSYAKTREVGLFLYSAGDTYGVIGVLPDSPAARFGLKPGDAFVHGTGSDSASLEQILQKIAAGESMLIARQRGSDDWVRLRVPGGTEVSVPRGSRR